MVFPVVGAIVAGAGMLKSYSDQRNAANQMKSAANENFRMRQHQAADVIERFKYNRIRERLNAQRFSGKQIVAFAKGGVAGRMPLSAVEDTIGVVEESLLNKQIDAEMEAYAILTQGKFDRDAAHERSRAAKNQATAGLLKGGGSLAIGLS